MLVWGGYAVCSAEVLRYHTLVVDGQNKIIPWFAPTTNAFDNFLDQCWSWALAAPYDGYGLPISFLYCAWNPGNPPTASAGWENDVGEKIPNWVESARLYYQYTGDPAPLDYVKDLVDYSHDNGQTPTNHVWPDFPVGTANAGDTEFRGFTDVWALWDCHVDLAADIGFAMYRMYQIYGDAKYRAKAIHVADLLAGSIVAGSATNSPWPYVVNSQTGATKSRYAASWDGALQLFDLLIKNNQGSVSSYTNARATLKNWLLTYPMQNGNWVDGHSDNYINGTNNWSNTCASDMCLYMLSHPDWDPDFMTNVPRLLKWTEDYFVNVSSIDGLSGQYRGAYVPAEQIAFMCRMGYQAARLGAQYAQWYAVSGDATYKDRAYRCFSYNTYMMQDSGQSADGPTELAQHWWSDCYGEGPRMYYYGLAAVPEWAPPGENHLLYSSSVVTSVTYLSNSVSYTTFDNGSTETLRLTFTPGGILINGTGLAQRSDLNEPGWMFNPTNGVLRVRHDTGTNVYIAAEVLPLAVTTAALPKGITDLPYAATLAASGGLGPYSWSVAGEALPPGLSLDPDSGAITGTPTTVGIFNFMVQVSDASDPVGIATNLLSITNAGPLTSIAVTPVNPAIVVGESQQFTATGVCTDGNTLDVTSTATWSSANAAVATIDATGQATTALAGTTIISAALGGVTGNSTLTVLHPPLMIVTASLTRGTVGTAYSMTMMATGGVAPYTWSIASGSLPPGVTLASASGVISGTPTNAGNFDFTMQAHDADSPIQTTTKPFSLTVLYAPVITSLVGNTNNGTEADYLWYGGAWINAERFQVSSNITVSAIRAKVKAITGRYKCAVYGGASGHPTALMGSTEEVSNPGNGWQTFPLTDSVMLIGGSYCWLAIWSDDPNAWVYYSGNDGALRWERRDYGAWPELAATTGGSTLNYCIYAIGMVPTLTMVLLTPTNPIVLAGATQQFTATATYSDGSTENITSQAVWTSSNPTVASIASNGLATAVSPGSTIISAALAGFSGRSMLTVPACPVAFNQSLTNAEDALLAITLTASDPDGLATNFTLVTQPATGTLSGSVPNLTYMPPTNFYGAVTFTYSVNDGWLTSGVATVMVTITNINDAPRLPAPADAMTGVFRLVVVTNTATDVDTPAESLSYTLLSGTSATISTNGVIVWMPRTGPGTNRFTTIVNDGGQPAASATNTFNVMVTNAVEPPVIQTLTVSGGVATVEWSAMPDAVYRLQCVDAVRNTNWTDLPPDLTATGATATATNIVGSQPLRFYRVRVVP
jgi:hypothetical protein